MKDVVREVLAAVDIVDVLSDSVELKSAGSARFKGLCPFHQEKTPSFIVSRDRQTFYCFGCERGGDAITFLRDQEGLSFHEALQKLADRGGIQLRKFGGEGSREAQLRTQVLALSKLAARFYRDTLKTGESGKPGRDYLAQRGLRDSIIERFGLGHVPEGWRALVTHARESDIQESVLIGSGLAKRGERGGIYDLFRNRVIFPIRDVSGDVVAFGGRDLGDGPAKYINSPENPVYKKGRVLYGLYEARDAMRKSGQVLLVEGYFDLLRCFDAGIENVVATSGTALTGEQASLIRRYVSAVVVVFDGDRAGIRAALRSIGILTSAGLSVRVLALPDAQDPDDYIRSEGAEAFLALVESAADFVTFYVRMSAERTGTIEGRTEVARELFDIFKQIDDVLRRDEYVKHLAKALGMNAPLCREEFERHVRGDSGRNRVVREESASTQRVSYDDEVFVASLMHSPKLLEKVKAFVASELLGPGPVREVVDALIRADAGGVQGIESDEARRLYTAAAGMDASWEDEVVDKRLTRFRRDALELEASHLQEEIENAQRLHEDSKVDALMIRKFDVERELDQVGAA
ncbi:MAG: DNA primase [Candidatus Hydrogenedentes bacterium]|nr:DNA primase [Candidatus Hydrogenedentota bacterium]